MTQHGAEGGEAVNDKRTRIAIIRRSEAKRSGIEVAAAVADDLPPVRVLKAGGGDLKLNDRKAVDDVGAGEVKD
jgi:hypothetical protein